MKRKSFPEAMHEIENNPDIKTREQLIAEGVVTAELMGTESDEKAVGEAGFVPDEAVAKVATPSARQRKKSGTPTPSAASSAAASAIAKSAASMLANTSADSTPGRSAAARGAKRKAEDTPAATPPPAKQRAEMGTPASAPTSRSGRVIKQKKFLDDSDASEQPLTPNVASASKRGGGGTPASSQKEQRKMWVQVRVITRKHDCTVSRYRLHEGKDVRHALHIGMNFHQSVVYGLGQSHW